MLHKVCQQIWKLQQWPQNWERSGFTPILKKGNPKECSNYFTIALISHASKVMLKILQARLQQYVNHELPDVQAGVRKGRGTRDQIANISWIIEKARDFQKNIYFCFVDYAKAYDNMGDLINESSSFSFSGVGHPDFPFSEEYWLSALTMVLWECIASRVVKKIFVLGGGT